MKKILVAGTLILVSVVIGGCSVQTQTQQIDLSRTKGYTSLGELAGDSNYIISGQVVDQRVVYDVDPEIPVTISSVKVTHALKGEGPDVLLVRQIAGGVGDERVHVLEIGKNYLLYLTASGLKGNLSKQYYITGVDSGIYNSTPTSGSDKQYKRASHLDGDLLPETVSPAEPLG